MQWMDSIPASVFRVAAQRAGVGQLRNKLADALYQKVFPYFVERALVAIRLRHAEGGDEDAIV